MSKDERQLNKAITDFLGSAKLSQIDAQQHLFGSGQVADLERKLANHFQMKHAVCVSNATSGLFAVALAINLRSAEFITSPFTYGGTVASWLVLDNVPAFADIEPATLEMNQKKIRSLITKQTKAILAVDSFGIPCDSHKLREIADEFELWYIADCAQSFGATRKGLPPNCLADAIVISFTAGKVLFAGEGGAVLTNNTELYEKLIWYSQHPYRQKKELGLSISNEFSINGRIHPLSAIWANTTFNSSLAKLKTHQEFCFAVICALNEIGLTIPIEFTSQNITPTFFKLSAEWQKKISPNLLERNLNDKGFDLRVSNNTVELLYQQNAFIAQYPVAPRKIHVCPEAERQAQSRFYLRQPTANF